MNGGPTTIVLADDHPLVLAGIRRLIESGVMFQVVAECADGDAALAAIREHQPNIAVLDLKMPKSSGLSVLNAVVAQGLSTRVVLLAATITDTDVHVAVDSGVHGIVLKEWAGESLIECLNAVADGQRWLPPVIVNEAIDRELARLRHADDIANRLTSRERQIALRAADGLSSKQIAHEFGLREGTVKLHLHNVFNKLSISRRSELANLINKVRDRLN